MTGDVASRETMLEVQGDRVLVYRNGAGEPERVMTFVHVVGEDGHALHLINREGKTGHPDWPVKQALFNAIRPARENKFEAKWEVLVK